MGRKIKISNEMEQSIISGLLTESFSPSAEKVLVVKKYMDDNFSRSEINDIDSNGYPKKVKVVNMLINKEPVKSMSLAEFLLLLDDKFHSIITDDGDRKKFLKQVIKNWYTRALKDDGVLSVNFIK